MFCAVSLPSVERLEPLDNFRELTVSKYSRNSDEFSKISLQSDIIERVRMENDDQSTAMAKPVANSKQKLLKDLIKNVEEFITTKQIKALSESLKRIFYHGLSLDNRVSSTGWRCLPLVQHFDDSTSAT